MPPTTPRYRIPYGNPDQAMTALDTLIMGAWGPNLATLVAATRTFGYHGGWSTGGLIGDGTIVIPDNTTKYVQRTVAGVVSADAALDTNKLPMAIVTTVAGAITHFEDIRDLFFSQVFARIAADIATAIAGVSPLTTQDDLYVGGVAGAPARLAKGATDGFVLTMVGGHLAWAAPSGGGGGGADTYQNTVLQLHMDGTNGGTSFPDASALGQSVSRTSVTTDTSAPKFGSAAANFGGSGSKLVITGTKQLVLGQVMVIECWVKTTQALQFSTLIDKSNSGFNSGSWTLLFNNGSSTDGIVAWYNIDLRSPNPVLLGTTSIRDGNYHHVAIVGVGGLYMLFVDGVCQDQFSTNVNWTLNTLNVTIGNSATSGRDFVGLIDEVRFVKGAAPYTRDFGVPTAAYADS